MFPRLLVTSVLLGAFSASALASVTIVAPGSDVAGQSIGAWTADWWKWAFAQPATNNAFDDLTGANANTGQSGPVFFVAGTTGGTAERAFTVPAGKYLLIPLVNYEDSLLEKALAGDFAISAADLQTEVHEVADLFDSLVAEIDGVPVANPFDYREASPEFEYTTAVVRDNPFGAPQSVSSGSAFADGYWLMLEPLALGDTVEVRFGGGITQFGFSTEVTSTISSVPVPAALPLFSLALATLAGAGLIRKRKA